ncbi:hypothetical protein QBC38DRAFT_540507 [Podospora fimiseda]|uniref:DUF7708 domain-containing protein n=1 Tax=Podospora fimiseda TaxID=252190 RepID=A0AAN6YJP0_9PEZI|nr:hypothetical protein QBC38DRAFT_540507 [Podospora fimiseda]
MGRRVSPSQAHPSSLLRSRAPTLHLHFPLKMDQFYIPINDDQHQKVTIPDSTSIQDIQTVIKNSLTRYSDKHKFPKARKWLSRTLATIHHYANIFDAFVQHHPEYVAVAWGAMKFIFISVQNHENTIVLISRALSQIAQTLPQVELANILHPTRHMIESVEDLYASIHEFLLRACKWCKAGLFRHVLHSITRPPELRYKDLLEQIAEKSRLVEKLAIAGTQVEIRHINERLDKITAQLQTIQSAQALQSSALVDTNQRLSDLQFSQIMALIWKGQLGDPLVAFRFNKSLQAQLNVVSANHITNQFWKSQKLHEWDTDAESKIAVIKGNPNTRFAIKRFTVDIIGQLQTKNIPVLWTLPWPEGGSGSKRASPIEHLILQALQLDIHSSTENRMSLECARFQRATTEHQWAQLLGSSLSRIPSQVYLVIDLSILDPNVEPTETFSLLEAFRIKVWLLSYGRDYLQNSKPTSSDIIIPVRATQVPIKRQKRMGGAGNNLYRGKFNRDGEDMFHHD